VESQPGAGTTFHFTLSSSLSSGARERRRENTGSHVSRV